jgi:hypothetical protein
MCLMASDASHCRWSSRQGEPQSRSFGRMEYVCGVWKERILPNARGKVRVEGVTHVSARNKS